MTKELFHINTQAIFYNQHPEPIQRMLDYDFLCKKDIPSIAAIINPAGNGIHKCFFGNKEILIPVYQTTADAAKHHPNADVFINFASMRSAFATSKEAIAIKTICTISIIAEGMPENEARELIRLAKINKKWLIGPATVGAIKPGIFRIGNTGGTIDNILATKLQRAGSVGVVTVSGGMSNEIYNIVSSFADGTYEGIAVGGDKFPGSTLLDNVLRLEKEKGVKMLILLGEIGGTAELEVADAIAKKQINKPVVAWVSGTVAKLFPTEVQFGHAGAKSGVDNESAQFKNNALKKAGAFVPDSFNDFGKLVNKVFKKYVLNTADYVAPIDDNYNRLPIDNKEALANNIVRRGSNIISSISDDRGEEATYNKIPISKYADKSLGHVINALWFKGRLDNIAENFIELCLKLTADHGPAVATAHNSIVTSRAGKDVVSSLIAGLTTIGSRHGGAIDGAAAWALSSIKNNLSAKELIDQKKRQGEYIMGIGHKIKSAQNPDDRVTILKHFAKKHLKITTYLDFALAVEAETLKKRNNLILNVDGAIGTIFLDILSNCKFNQKELEETISYEVLNAIFVLGRTIGMLGHAIDQKRLQEGLYRHPWDDILYV
jgi:succinyl-CoA synthetase alpha subunit